MREKTDNDDNNSSSDQDDNNSSSDQDDNNSSSDQDDNNSSSDQDDNNSSSDQDETPVLKICEEISQILQRGTSEEIPQILQQAQARNDSEVGTSEESTKEAVVENKKITDDMMTKKPKHEFERQSTYYLCE